MATSLDEILDFSPGHGQALVPGLLGPTGAGKTMRAEAYAAAHGLSLEVVLLGTMLPEDVLGLPSVVRGVTQHSLPAWASRACERPSLVLLDEIDKARPEVLATVLTLISSREVRGHALHPATRIVLAGQPVDEFWLRDPAAEALSARACWLRVGYDYAAIERLGGIDLSWAPRPSAPVLPVLPVPSARQLLWLAQARHAMPAEVIREVAEGVLPAALVPEFLAAREVAQDASAYWVMRPADREGYLAALAPGELGAVMASAPTDADRDAALALGRAIGRTGDLDFCAASREALAALVPGCSRGEFGLVADGEFLC